MIVRIWSARTSADPDAYENEFRTHVLDALSGLDGVRGAYLLRRAHATGTEFVTLTLFDSLDDVRRFAGPDVEPVRVGDQLRVAVRGRQPADDQLASGDPPAGDLRVGRGDPDDARVHHAQPAHQLLDGG